MVLGLRGVRNKCAQFLGIRGAFFAKRGCSLFLHTQKHRLEPEKRARVTLEVPPPPVPFFDKQKKWAVAPCQPWITHNGGASISGTTTPHDVRASVRSARMERRCSPVWHATSVGSASGQETAPRASGMPKPARAGTGRSGATRPRGTHGCMEKGGLNCHWPPPVTRAPTSRGAHCRGGRPTSRARRAR